MEGGKRLLSSFFISKKEKLMTKEERKAIQDAGDARIREERKGTISIISKESLKDKAKKLQLATDFPFPNRKMRRKELKRVISTVMKKRKEPAEVTQLEE